MTPNINNYMKECNLCKMQFESPRSYSNHVRWVHKKISFHNKIQCKYCGWEVANHQLQKHEDGCSKNPINIGYCKQCNVLIDVNDHKRSFCSSSCAATYNNTHKTQGYRRSKLEVWLEDQLKLMYPDLEIHFNHKDIINSELDIYIPSLKIAFELNGIFHYEIIYSSDQLTKIQNNDNRKYQACIDKGISLCVIDTSKQKQFKEKTSKIYLDIITSIINGPIA
jgi:hypothetical protein